MKRTIGIIGCGNMGEAILNQKSKIKNQKFIFSEKDNKRRIYIQKKYHIPGFKDNKEVIRLSDVIIIAVKPQDIDEILAQIRNNLTHRLVVISIAAGVTTGYIEKRIGSGLAVIRVMPNLAARVAEGMSVLCKGRFAKKRDLNLTEKIFQTMGKTLIMQERYLNAVTAISGSGPAYFYYFIQALIAAGCKLGMNSRQAEVLVKQTALGAIRLLEESRLSPQALMDLVTSKRGTTEAALKIFKQKGLVQTIQKAVFAANKRAEELSKEG